MKYVNAVTTFAVLSVIALSTRAPARGAKLTLNIIDETGVPLPCRVLIRPANGECIVPGDAIKIPTPPDQWFACPGKVTLEVPDGRVLVRVERGLEFERYKQEIEVEGSTTETVRLTRWINMRSKGYLCGENHIHIAPADLGPMLVSEGLDFGTALTWWNGPDARRPIPPDCERVTALEFAGQEVPTSIYDAELEYGWGAAYIQNLPESMPIETDRNRPNLDYVCHACQAGGLVSYQAGWSREVLLDALLGHVHVVNVCNNNFHLHRFQPRSHYSNLLEVPGFPVYEDTDHGMMQMNTDTYYRLLNCGLRLAAGAGTACGVKPNPVGYNRTYVRAPTGAKLADFNQAWAAGRNFVTNGPMVFLSASTGQKPGDTVELPATGGRVSLGLSILSDQPLASAEIVVNGQVANVFDVAGMRQVEETAEVTIQNGSWIAARCTATDKLLNDNELSVYRWDADDHRMRQRPSRLRYAHTSAIYCTVAGQGPAIPESIEEGLAMLDQFKHFARRTASEEHLDKVLNAVQHARKILLERLHAN